MMSTSMSFRTSDVKVPLSEERGSHWLLFFWRSTIGKKVVMALTPIATMIMTECSLFSRTASYGRSLSDLRSEDKPFHGKREALFLVGSGHKPGSVLHI
jgi:hypothetical protein